MARFDKLDREREIHNSRVFQAHSETEYALSGLMSALSNAHQRIAEGYGAVLLMPFLKMAMEHYIELGQMLMLEIEAVAKEVGKCETEKSDS